MEPLSTWLLNFLRNNFNLITIIKLMIQRCYHSIDHSTCATMANTGMNGKIYEFMFSVNLINDEPARADVVY